MLPERDLWVVNFERNDDRLQPAKNTFVNYVCGLWNSRRVVLFSQFARVMAADPRATCGYRVFSVIVHWYLPRCWILLTERYWLTAFYRDSQRSGRCLLISLAPIFADKNIRDGLSLLTFPLKWLTRVTPASFSSPFRATIHTCLQMILLLKISSQYSVTNRRWLNLWTRGCSYFDFLWQSRVTPATVRHFLVHDHGMDVFRCFSSPLKTVTKHFFVHYTCCIKYFEVLSASHYW